MPSGSPSALPFLSLNPVSPDLQASPPSVPIVVLDCRRDKSFFGLFFSPVQRPFDHLTHRLKSSMHSGRSPFYPILGQLFPLDLYSFTSDHQPHLFYSRQHGYEFTQLLGSFQDGKNRSSFCLPSFLDFTFLLNGEELTTFPPGRVSVRF